METLHSVLEAMQISSLDLASRVGVGTGWLAFAGVACVGRCPVDRQPLFGVREDREKMLIFRASPDIALRMVGEARGPHALRAAVRMARGKFQN